MPSDSELRRRFQEGTQPRGEIDLDAVLRRSRARRRPRVVLAGAGSILAIAAIAVPAVVTSYTGSGVTTDSAFVAGDSDEAAAPEAAGGGMADTQVLPDVTRINLCGASVAEAAPAPDGLAISAAPVTADAADRGIPVTVTLTNDGPDRIFGTTPSRPALTLARDGVTIWHTNGPSDLMARIVDLRPGESMTYETTFEPVVCAPEDDAGESFREELPAAGPGTYLLTAVIEVSHDDGSAVDLVTGPAVAVTLN